MTYLKATQQRRWNNSKFLFWEPKSTERKQKKSVPEAHRQPQFTKLAS